MSAELAGNTYLPRDPDEFVSWAFNQRGGLQLMADRIRRAENEQAQLRISIDGYKLLIDSAIKRLSDNPKETLTAATVQAAETIVKLRATVAEQARALAEADGRDKKRIDLLRGMLKGWREYAEGHYCRTYNVGSAQGLEDAAIALEAFLDGWEKSLLSAHPAPSAAAEPPPRETVTLLDATLKQMIRIGNALNWHTPIDQAYADAINAIRAALQTEQEPQP